MSGCLIVFFDVEGDKDKCNIALLIRRVGKGPVS